MEHKPKLKKYLIYSFITLILLLILFLIINIYEYHIYTKNFNYKISAIVSEIKEKYPNISENEIMHILNSKHTKDITFEKYGIDITKDSIIIENEKKHHQFLIINTIFLSLSFLSLILIFII